MHPRIGLLENRSTLPLDSNLPPSQSKKVQDYLIKGLPRHELEESIQAIFRGADGDGSGALDRAEFIRCLKESGLGFTRRELNLILSRVC